MKTPIFTGAAVAIITPMLPDGSVDYKGLADLIEFQIKGGTDAVVICGTTGESATLKDDEHLECIRVAVETAAGRIPVIAGPAPTTPSTRWRCPRRPRPGARTRFCW